MHCTMLLQRYVGYHKDTSVHCLKWQEQARLGLLPEYSTVSCKNTSNKIQDWGAYQINLSTYKHTSEQNDKLVHLTFMLRLKNAH